MSDNTDLGENSPEDNEVISGLRKQVDTLSKAVKTAGADAIAKVKRTQTASSLMPKGFEGLSDIFETEVDGELDAASAAEWLKGRGFTASSDEAKEKAAETAKDLEAVTDLGSAVAAAGGLSAEDSVTQQLGEVVTPGTPQTLLDVINGVDKVLNG